MDEVEAVADRALGFVEGEGQVFVVWEREIARAVSERLRIDITCVEGGRGGRAGVAAADDRHLERAAKRARLMAKQARAWPAPRLPSPRAGTPHGSWDASLATATSLEKGATALVARTAVVSTTGVRACEQRSAIRAGDRVAPTRAALEPEWRVEHEPGDGLVLGPVAVATVLDMLRSAFGVDRALDATPLRAGDRIAPPIVTLTDVPDHPRTLPRSYDAEGLPRRTVTLISAGVVEGAVLDSAAAARIGAQSTGHATRPAALAPMPENLVLEPGAATRLRGRYIERLLPGEEPGRRRAVGPDMDVQVAVDPLEVLATTEALTEQRMLVPLRPHCPGGLGSALVPALRARGGVRA